MDIRTKLVLALGAFTYGVVRELLQGIAVRQLEAVAESKKQGLAKVIAAWRERVQLVTSRTKLRESLAEVSANGDDPETQAQVARILSDAVEAVESLRAVTVYAANGHRIAGAGLDPAAEAFVRPATFWLADAPVVLENVSRGPDGQLMVAFIAPIRARGRLVGGAKVLLSARDLVDVTRDYTGLGETGETLVAQRTGADGALILNPLRHDADATLRRTVSPDRDDDPTLHAVRGREAVFREGARDYRDREVWAATRHLEDFDWGLVVKVDAVEEWQPVIALRSTMWKLAVSLSAFAILAGAILGIYFARPIRELADVARRIREGELDLRARTDAEDEVALLAETFNAMTEELIQKNRELERRVGGDDS